MGLLADRKGNTRPKNTLIRVFFACRRFTCPISSHELNEQKDRYFHYLLIFENGYITTNILYDCFNKEG